MKDSCELGASVRVFRHDWKNMVIFVLSGIVFLFFLQLRERSSLYLLLDTTSGDLFQSPVTTARSSSHHLKFRPAIDEESLYDEEFIIHENEFTSTVEETSTNTAATATTTTMSTTTTTALTTGVVEENENCPVRDTATWDTPVEPIYKLRNDRFL
ncbi:Oidioi.mRNA.OKI2018_I69.XSR.g15530.t1.cds [Oikopleura dioica]|uniref:Oidioi.mRNA.OKI2018_I69.XSR.g15530.t1.cds n=1 Tax=Oikopleura dioica TaxID=34765 RepID=A0ABN7SH74_OIKDI|nr:Oidioi.mRNA.OKI2018_I69.XSR.g15530.t1.cds [Oikopleura dioica]